MINMMLTDRKHTATHTSHVQRQTQMFKTQMFKTQISTQIGYGYKCSM